MRPCRRRSGSGSGGLLLLIGGLFRVYTPGGGCGRRKEEEGWKNRTEENPYTALLKISDSASLSHPPCPSLHVVVILAPQYVPPTPKAVPGLANSDSGFL